MTAVRRAAVAGTFYPDNRSELGALVDRLLDGATPADTGSDTIVSGPPVALIVPHAGYTYSGPVAASAYVHLRPWRPAISRVVVVGPAHRSPVHGLALSSARAFDTPLGRIPLDLVANDVFVPEYRVQPSEEFLGAKAPSIHDNEPWAAYPFVPVATMTLAAVALGMAEGAYEEFKNMMVGRTLAFSGGAKQVEQPTSQMRLWRQDSP